MQEKVKKGNRNKDGTKTAEHLVLEEQLQLNGRDLIIFEAKGKAELTEITEEGKKKKVKEDTRNLGQKSVGLINYHDFFHSEISESQRKQREGLLQHKELALNKSPNLFVSKLRLALRNLPLHRFYEGELRELLNEVVAKW
jgi:hypothetical protein